MSNIKEDYHIFLMGTSMEGKCDVGNVLVKQKSVFHPFACTMEKGYIEEKIGDKKKAVKVVVHVVPDINIKKDLANTVKQAIVSKPRSMIVLVKSDRTAKSDSKLMQWIGQLGINISSLSIGYDPKQFSQKKNDVRQTVMLHLKKVISDKNGGGDVGGSIQRSCNSQSTPDNDSSEDEQDETVEDSLLPLSLDPGEEERELFCDTLREGKAPSNLVPVIVVGNENAGKTTLIKRLLTLDDPSANPGDSCTTSCMINNGGRVWETMRKDFLEELNLQRMAQAMKTTLDKQVEMKEALKDSIANNHGEVHQGGHDKICADSSTALNPDEWLGSDCIDDESPTVSKIYDYTALARTFEKDKYLREVAARINQCKEPKMFFTYREYGGLDTNALSYQAFLPPRAVYLLVVDLSLDFDKKLSTSMREKYRQCTSKCLLKEYTLQQMIWFWASSIRRYARDKDDEPAPIILVATRKDMIKADDAEEKIRKIKDQFGKNLDIEDLSVVHVDTRSGDEKELEHLRDLILDSSQTYGMEEISAQWIELEHELLLKRQRKASLQFHELKSLDMKSDIPMKCELKLNDFLEFQHNSGQVIYIPNLKEESEIILNPIVFIEFLRTLKQKGKNRRKSVDVATISTDVVKDTEKSVEAKLNVTCDFNVILNLLVYFNIIIPFSHPDKEGFYFLPCLLNLTANESKTAVVEKAPTIQILFKECHMHPMFYYQFLFSILQYLKSSKEPELFDLFARIFLDKQTVYFEIQWDSSSIFICLKNLSHSTKLRDLDCPHFLTLIKEQVKASLQKQSQEKVEYEMKIECDQHEKSFVSLTALEKDNEAACDSPEVKHAVGKGVLGVYGPSLEKQTPTSCITNPALLPLPGEKPSDKDLGRLARHLTEETTLSLSRLLGRRGSVAETKEITSNFGPGEEGRMELLKRWKLSNPSGTVDKLVKLLTQFHDYDENHILGIIKKPLESHTFDLDSSLLEKKPSDEWLMDVCGCIVGKHSFMFLELGLEWKVITVVQHQCQTDLHRCLHDLLVKWKSMFPREASLQLLLNTLHNFGCNTNTLVDKLRQEFSTNTS